MDISSFKIKRSGDHPIIELAKEIYRYVPEEDKSTKLKWFIVNRIVYYGYSSALNKWKGILEGNPKSYYKTFLSKDKYDK